ncbi:hypothetical protein AB6D11_00580 [Vibrio splendidus]
MSTQLLQSVTKTQLMEQARASGFTKSQIKTLDTQLFLWDKSTKLTLQEAKDWMDAEANKPMTQDDYDSAVEYHELESKEEYQSHMNAIWRLLQSAFKANTAEPHSSLQP